MLSKILIIIAAIVVCVFCQSGCKKSSSKGESEQVKTMAEYEAEAEEQITKDNVQQELQRIEKALEQDIAAEP